jgi:hypothetical protein
MAGGLKSELKRTERSFAKQQEDEEEEEEDTSVYRNIGRTLMRFVYALAVFGVLLVGSAYVLWIYERPIEEQGASGGHRRAHALGTNHRASVPVRRRPR